MTIRTKLALALSLSILLAGGCVILISALTYQHAIYQSPTALSDDLLERIGVSREQAEQYIREHPEVVLDADTAAPGPNGGPSVDESFQAVQRAAQDDAISRSRRWSLLALGGLSIVAALAGWAIAGRTVRPVRLLAARAHRASELNLGEPVHVGGAHDEIRELAETFDHMLMRLDAAFQAQRRFSTQVSHELRNPLAIITSETELLRSTADEAQVQPLDEISAAAQRAERIIEGLLVLARSNSGDLARQELDLEQLTGDALGYVINEPSWRELRVDVDLAPAPMQGDPALVGQVVLNLLSNAARHNRTGGSIDVATWSDDGHAVLQVGKHDRNTDARPEHRARRRRDHGQRALGQRDRPHRGRDRGLCARRLHRVAGRVARDDDGAGPVPADTCRRRPRHPDLDHRFPVLTQNCGRERPEPTIRRRGGRAPAW